MKKLLFLLAPILFFAQVPVPNYYNSINFSQEPEEVKNQLANLITTTHTHILSYTPEVWDALRVTDLDPEDKTKNNVLLVYGYDDNDGNPQTDRTRYKYQSHHGGNPSGKWNREHIYPKSLGTPNLGTENAGSDAHHIRAVDSSRNSKRNNRKFADGQGFSHITNHGHWFPGDEWKGDVARMIMYMHLRYPTQTPANRVAYSTHNISSEMPDIFLIWNVLDPVSEYEIQRNEYLEQAQGNRNPFIDNPYLATLIWGGEPAEDTWKTLSTAENIIEEIQFVVYPNPTSSMIYYNYNGKSQIHKIYVTNMAGQVVIIDNNLKDNKVDMPTTKGTYLVNFEFNNQSISKKVIVE